MQIPLPTSEQALPGRDIPILISNSHFVNGNPIIPPFSEEIKCADFALGCFWGAERKFWEIKNVFSTAVGYMGGFTPNASYEEVCSGLTGHTETVRVFFDDKFLDYKELLRIFWESHNPTQGMRQGNDIGTQYRSGIWVEDQDQLIKTEESLKAYEESLLASGFEEIKTTVEIQKNFYYAEEHHQQYLHKNPNGYCGIAGTGVLCK